MKVSEAGFAKLLGVLRLAGSWLGTLLFRLAQRTADFKFLAGKTLKCINFEVKYPFSTMLKLAVICCLVLFSCSQPVEDKFRNSTIPTERWAYQMNTGSDSLGQLYEPEAYLTVQSDRWQLVQGQAEVAAYYLDRNIGPIDSLSSAGRVKASETIDYEIVRLQGPAKGYVQLVVWKRDGSAARRQLEVLAEAGAVQSGWRPEIDSARKEWMKFCNSHDPARLVSEVYTADALYYNHKPMVVGTTAITREYGYMADAEYKLSLSPLAVEPVSSTLVFEIGQCSGSYGGKYMLVWMKNGDGRWQVQLDSNI